MRTYLTIIKALLVLFSWTLIDCAQAVEVRDLDDASIKVSSRDKSERTKALKKAFSQVLVKNTGDVSILSHELVKSKLRNPSSMLSQYRYIDQQEQLLLLASFDHKRLLSLLRQAQAPIWGKQRPLTLFWLVNETPIERQIIGDVSADVSREQLLQAASKSALPLLLPLLDLDDVMAVGVADVRGGFNDIVGKASERYQAEFFALASLAQEAGSEVVSYKLALYEQSDYGPFTAPLLHLESTSNSRESAIDIMTNETARFYASRYGVSDSGQKLSSRVAFDSVDALDQLVAIEGYLKQLTAVKSVQLSQVQGKRIIFDVELFGSEDDLLKQLTLEPNVTVQANIDLNERYDSTSVEDIEQITTFIWAKN